MISLDADLFSKESYENLSKYDKPKLALFIQLGYQIFKKSNYKINIEIDSKPNIKHDNKIQTIGVIGENYVENILNPYYNIINVSKTNYSGDFIVNKTDYGNILTEVKNYSSIVPSSEIEKFKRDLSLNNNVIGGIFISLNTKIQNINETFLLNTYINSNDILHKIPIIYLCSNDPELIKASFELLWGYKNNLLEINNDKINKKINKISNLLNGLILTRSNLNDIKDNVSKQISKTYDILFTTEMQIRKSIESLYEIIPGENINNIKYKNYLNLFNTIKTNYVNSLILSNDVHQTILKKISELINSDDIIVVTNKEIIIKNNNVNILIITPLKTKTVIGINTIIKKDNSLCKIPLISKYSNGWITFELEKTINKSDYIEMISELISHLLDHD